MTRFGMSKKFGLIGLESIESQYLDGRAVLNCSDATAAEIDQEVMRILKECYQEALELLSHNREVMDKLAAFLIERETITGKEFMEIFHRIEGIDPEQEGKKSEERISMNPTEEAAPEEEQAGDQEKTEAQGETEAGDEPAQEGKTVDVEE